jgi:hypothetical protein
MSYNREMDGYGPEDFVIPEIKLIQNVGGETAKGEGAKPGDFYIQITGEKITEPFNITVIDIRKQRTYWGRTEIADEPPVCSSADGKTSLNGEECDKCPYEARNDTPWLLSADERRKKCLLHYTILAIKDSMPVIIRAGGISIQGVRELLTQLRQNRQLKGEYHRAVVKVSSVKKKTAAGEAFQMQLRAADLISDAAKVKELLELSNQFLGIALPVGTPEEETPAEATQKAPEAKSEVTPKPEPKPEAKPAAPPAPVPEAQAAEVSQPGSEEPEPEPEKLDVDF